MTVPTWVLTLSYWLHMLATVLWIGGLTAVSLLLIPVLQKKGETDNTTEQAAMLTRLQRGLDPLAWFSLLLLIATGLVQMSASPQYEGFLAVTNRWSLAILLKHIVFFSMIGVSAYLTWGNLPALQRAVLRQSRGKESPELAALQRKNVLLLRANLLLAVIVLALTALARASV